MDCFIPKNRIQIQKQAIFKKASDKVKVTFNMIIETTYVKRQSRKKNAKGNVSLKKKVNYKVNSF